jgi:ankyrin repeat protein
MSIKIAYLFLLLTLTPLVYQATASARFRHWRSRLLFVILGAWLGGLGSSVVDALEHRTFFQAVQSGNLDSVRTLLAEDPELLYSRNLVNNTALHMAVDRGNEAMVVLLIRAGANVNAKRFSDETPLHLAAFHGFADIGESLLKAGADVNAIGYRHNDTPLHVAAHHGHAKMVELLLDYGAERDKENFNHETPRQTAQKAGRADVVAIRH